VSAIRPELRVEQRLQLSQSLGNSLMVLRMSGPELFAALALEGERNPFLEVRLPEPDAMGAREAPDEEEDFAAAQTWRGDLLDQCRRSGWAAPQIAAVEALIHQLDDEGYLRTPEEELKGLPGLRGLDAAGIRAARARLGQLSPVGMGATDLRERLLMQLDDLAGAGGAGDALATARRIVAERLDDLAGGRIAGTGLPAEEEALALIGSLAPNPADSYAQGVAPRLADLVARKSGTLWRIEPGPGLDIGLAVAESPLSSSSKWDPKAREAAAGLWRSASGLSQAVSYRRRRLLEIAQAVIDRQRPFLERGRAGLRPLRMADVAEEVGSSTATVSLAIRGKTLASPQGFHELKYLIPRSFSNSGIARELMKEALKRAIAGEDPQAPKSDRELAETLADHGAPSRRAVAQLRAELRLPPAHGRRATNAPAAR